MYSFIHSSAVLRELNGRRQAEYRKIRHTTMPLDRWNSHYYDKIVHLKMSSSLLDQEIQDKIVFARSRNAYLFSSPLPLTRPPTILRNHKQIK